MIIFIKTLRSSNKNEEKLAEHLNRIYDATEKDKDVGNSKNASRSLSILEKCERELRTDLGKRKQGWRKRYSRR